jgi:pimeloyl-ACP methyl ester carboxylesterase
MLVKFASDQDAFPEEDVELFLARLREPARARAGSALYRNFILLEAVRILGGSYRSTRLSTPTRVLVGADDPNIRPEFLHGYEDYVDDLELEFVGGASHFVADDRPDVVLDRALELFAQP